MKGGVWVAGEIVAATGVEPVFGLSDEASGDGVAVHVAQFLEALSDGEDVEVVVAGLPELLGSDLFRDGEFEGLEGFGEGFCFGFAEEEMDVFGHEDVAVDVEVVAFPGLFEFLFEQQVERRQGGFAAVATEGDEVEMAFLLVARDHPTSGSSRGPRKDGRLACLECEGFSLPRKWPTLVTMRL